MKTRSTPATITESCANQPWRRCFSAIHVGPIPGRQTMPQPEAGVWFGLTLWVALGVSALAAAAHAQQSLPKSVSDAWTTSKTIKTILGKQADAWNRGDIDAFMEYYWKSDSLTFSSQGVTTRGWAATKENYKRRYPTREQMGQLTFDRLEVRMLGETAALVLGHWRLRRESGPVGGNFSLVWNRFDGDWLIIHDHTSRLEEATPRGPTGGGIDRRNPQSDSPSSGRQGNDVSDRGGSNRSANVSPDVRDQSIGRLPDIRRFRSNPSDRFIVDLSVVRSGHPYKGEAAQRPHTGGHVYFHTPDESASPDHPSRYPAIYAIADGLVSRVDYSFQLKEMYESALGRRVANDRYGVALMFAKSNDHPIYMQYSIEPFVDPGEPSFYDRFILVKPGQWVRKGEVLARMYIPPNSELAQKSHIHFNLTGGRNHRFMAPTVFTTEIARRFHATWERFGTDGAIRIPPCLGYKLAPHENPFGDGAKDVL